MNKKYHYVYRITNTKLNKHYYGTRTSTIEPIKDLGIKYFSSSHDHDFMNDQKNNPHDYKYIIVSIFNLREEAILFEIKLHNRFNVGINESFYNKVKQNTTKFDFSGKRHSEKTKSKMSIITSERQAGKTNSFYGKKHTTEWKENASKNRKGTVYSQVECPHCNLIGGINVMKMHHFDKCEDKSISIKRAEQITCNHCGKTGGAAGMWRHHFDNCKYKQ